MSIVSKFKVVKLKIKAASKEKQKENIKKI